MVSQQYDAYLSGVLKSLDTLYEKKRQQLGQQLAGRPRATLDYYQNELNQAQMNQYGEIIPKMNLEASQAQQGQENWQKQYDLQRSGQTMQSSLGYQQLEEQRRRDELARAFQEYNVNLQNEQLLAQSEAARRNNETSWVEPLLTTVGTVAGAYYGAGNPLAIEAGRQAGKGLANSFAPRQTANYNQNIGMSDMSGLGLKNNMDYTLQNSLYGNQSDMYSNYINKYGLRGSGR